MSAPTTAPLQRATARPAFTPAPTGSLQRKCACGNHTVAGGECEECRKKKQPSLLQTKRAINKHGRIHRQEADRSADQPMIMPARSGLSDEQLQIQRFSGQAAWHTDVAPPSVTQALADPGKPLQQALRRDMEQHFAHDFSQVRVHSGVAAEQSAADVNAHAYAAGNHIVFGAGRFAPETSDGRRLLAHELAHVVQQSHAPAGFTQFKAVSRPRDAGERAADAAADAVLAGRAAPPQPLLETVTIARQSRCITGHMLGQGEVVPEDEKRGNTELHYRIWGTWRKSDTSLASFAERVVNAWIPWRFGPLAPEDRHKVSNFLFTTALGRLGTGAGEAGCDYAIVLSKPTLEKAVELTGEPKRAAELQRAREDLARKPWEQPDYGAATVSQRLVLLEERIRLWWTGNQDEDAILDILRTTPDNQAAELSRRLSTDRYGENESYLAALDRVVDLGNNLELHTEFTRLHLRGLGGEQGTKAILDDAPILPWHDVMGFGNDVPATFSLQRGSGGKITIKYHRGLTLVGTNMPYQGELDALPREMFIGGKAYDPDQIFKVHDWDEGKFVVVRARDLLAYQNIGIRNWLGHMATVASFAIPGGAAATTAGKVALFTIERAIPLLILAVRENRLSLVKWFPTWGPRMIYFADIAELAIGLYGVANFARSGAKFFNAWREARFARKLWEAAENANEVEKAAVRIEKEADKILKAADEFQQAEGIAAKGKAAGSSAADLPEGSSVAKGNAVSDARTAASDTPPAGPSAKLHGAPGEQKVLAREPVKGGHHIDVTEAGIELCSPKPCPLLRVEYVQELKRNPMLAKQMDELDALRKTDPAAAAKKSASLRESLDYTRAHARLFDGLPAHATPEQKLRLAKLLDTAEDAHVYLGEQQLEEIRRRLMAGKSTAELDAELAMIERNMERATGVVGEFEDAARLGGGSKTKDVPHDLPEGTQASGTTTKPRTATLTDAELLAAELTKRIGPRPPGHEAHHIVPKGMKEGQEARDILREAGIGVNDAENGIWLPKDSSVANELTLDVHSKVHTARAIRLITEQLREGAKDGPEGVRRALRLVQRTLSDLRFER